MPREMLALAFVCKEKNGLGKWQRGISKVSCFARVRAPTQVPWKLAFNISAARTVRPASGCQSKQSPSPSHQPLSTEPGPGAGEGKGLSSLVGRLDE